MDRRDILLLVINASGQSMTPIQLQKALFLIGEAGLSEVTSPFYQFEPYNYGPFAVEIYDDAKELQNQGLVIQVPSQRGNWVETSINADGQSKASDLEKALPTDSREFIRDTVEWVLSQTFNSLVRSIYNLFPKYRQNSVFQR